MEVCWDRGGEGEGALLLPREVGGSTRECTIREEGRSVAAWEAVTPHRTEEWLVVVV